LAAIKELLSDGGPIKVRRLKFLELEEQCPYLDLGPYIHTYMVEGHPQQVAYGLQDFGETPERPDTPYEMAQPGSMEEALWGQYNLYRAILTHEHKRSQSRQDYLVETSRYILDNCIEPADRERIVTPEDFKLVYRLALCPEIVEEDIVAVLAQVFQSELEGEVFMGLIEKSQEIGRHLHSNSPMGTPIHAESQPD